MNFQKFSARNLLFISLLFVLAVSSCQQSEKNFFIYEKEISIEPGSEQTIYLGVKNINNKDRKFRISYECRDCGSEITMQMFSEIGLKANMEGAFPAKVIAGENAENNKYGINLKITDIEENTLFSSEKIIVEIKKFNKNYTKIVR